MRAFLKNIAQQDYESRKRWFAILTAGTSLVIFLAWLIIVNVLNTSPLAKKEVEPDPVGASVFATMKDAVTDAWKKTKDSLSSAVIEFEKSTTPPVTTPTSSTSTTN